MPRRDGGLTPTGPVPGGPAVLPIGSAVRQVTSKYGGRPHWEFDTVLTAADDVGAWLFMPAGSRMVRPGRDLRTTVASITLVPHTDPYVATFHAVEDGAAGWMQWRLYVDMTTPAVWRGPDLVTMLDLDLDVVLRMDGDVEILDEDELVENSVAYGYPRDLVTLATRSAAEVAAAIRSGAEPFGRLGWRRLREAVRAYG